MIAMNVYLATSSPAACDSLEMSMCCDVAMVLKAVANWSVTVEAIAAATQP